jgi:hypothetical protein
MKIPKSRQIASGVLTGTCKPLKHICSTVKRMGDVDKVEIIKFNVWKNDDNVTVFGIYNPLQNNLVVAFLVVSR